MKNKPFMNVSIPLDRDDVRYHASAILNTLLADYSSAAMVLTGLDYKELREDLISSRPFQEMVRKAVEKDGLDAFGDPRVYMDFDTVYSTQEWQALLETFDMMESIVDELQPADRKVFLATPS